MEQYLKEQYNVIDLSEELESHEEIKDWCSDLDDLEEELFILDDEVVSEEETVIIKIKDKFYKVVISCESELQRSDYWRGYKSVLISTKLKKYVEIPKPIEKSNIYKNLKLKVRLDKLKEVKNYLTDNNIEFEQL